MGALDERIEVVRCFGNSQLDLFALHFVMELVVALAPAAELFSDVVVGFERFFVDRRDHARLRGLT